MKIFAVTSHVAKKVKEAAADADGRGEVTREGVSE
jgi:hypothetical protein